MAKFFNRVGPSLGPENYWRVIDWLIPHIPCRPLGNYLSPTPQPSSNYLFYFIYSLPINFLRAEELDLHFPYSYEFLCRQYQIFLRKNRRFCNDKENNGNLNKKIICGVIKWISYLL